MDIIDDVRYGIIHELLTVLGLREVILDHHPTLSPPTSNYESQQLKTTN
jgi:hypothetical protein